MRAETAGFGKPTDSDHRAWLWVSTVLSILYTSCFLIARVFAKYGMLWWDDIILGLAYVSQFRRRS